jgi:phage tail sheath gpL-like
MVSPSSISRVCGVEATYRNFNQGVAAMLNQRLTVIGVGNDNAVYDLEKHEVFTAALVAERYGWGSPLHLVAEQLLPAIGAAAEFPVTMIALKKATGATAVSGSIGITGTAEANGSGVVYIGGIRAEFAAAKGAVAATVLGNIKTAIDGVLSMPAITGTIADGELPLTTKWSGGLGNGISIVIEADIPGLMFSITNFSSDAFDPDVTSVLEKIGIAWETFILTNLFI